MTVTLHTGALSLSLAQQSPGDDAGYTIEKEEEFSLFFFFFISYPFVNWWWCKVRGLTSNDYGVENELKCFNRIV